MSIFVTFLYFTYVAVALFYLASGILLLLYPKTINHRLSALFPLLASFKYSRRLTSLNLILVGAGLLILSESLQSPTLFGFFCALVLSGLEVFLGVKFYYLEENNLPQALIHVILHTVLVVLLFLYLLLYFPNEISFLQQQAASLISI